MYGKIFESIYKGSLMTDGGFMAVYTFITMIVNCDKDGVVDMSEKALGKLMGLPNEMVIWDMYRGALTLLESEDEGSNLPAEGGRRIIPMGVLTNGESNRGWWIVNHEYYKKLGGKHDQKEKTRERVRRFRERQKV